jgi:hypothetical protein
MVGEQENKKCPLLMKKIEKGIEVMIIRLNKETLLRFWGIKSGRI